MLIKREKTDAGLPMISFLQRAPYTGYPNLLIGDETPDSLHVDPTYPGVVFVKQPVWISVFRARNGSLLLRRLCSQREQEDQDLPKDGQAWPLDWVEDFTLSRQLTFGELAIPILIIQAVLRTGERSVIACHTGEPIEGVRQLLDELRAHMLPLRTDHAARQQAAASAAAQAGEGPDPAEEPPPEGQPPDAFPVPPLGPLTPSLGWVKYLAVIVVGGCVVAFFIGYLRQREEEEARLAQKAFEAPIRHAVNIGQLFHAITDVLRPYCTGVPHNCINAKVRKAADYSWEVAGTPASLRILLNATYDPVTKARTATLRMDFATLREGADVARDYPPLAEISDKIMRQLQFPDAYLRVNCAAPTKISDGRRFGCTQSRYDPDFGAFDQNAGPQFHLYTAQKTFTMVVPWPFYYDKDTTPPVHYGERPPFMRGNSMYDDD